MLIKFSYKLLFTDWSYRKLFRATDFFKDPESSLQYWASKDNGTFKDSIIH